mmetsp:Transcript_22327/g.69939  ORF Transcript_22327/g.69939 Transcript_22327/m.69939 type:complete len:284 (-) Transcript_22327:4752-5603(-)
MTLFEATKSSCRSCSSAGATTTRPPERPLPQPSFASPRTLIVTPGASVNPRLCPVDELRLIVIVPSGSPGLPSFLEMSEESIVPNVRSTFVSLYSRSTGSGSFDESAAYASMIGVAASMSCTSAAFFSSSWSCCCTLHMPSAGFSSRAGWSSGARSSPRVLSGRPRFLSAAGSTSNTSPAAPTSSPIDFMPSEASMVRNSSASSQKKLMTCSGWPSNFARSTGSWVAMPTGHEFWWPSHIAVRKRAKARRTDKEKRQTKRTDRDETNERDERDEQASRRAGPG